MPGHNDKKIFFLGLCKTTHQPIITVGTDADDVGTLRLAFKNNAGLRRGVPLTEERLTAALAHAESIGNKHTIEELKHAQAAVQRAKKEPTQLPKNRNPSVLHASP